MGAEAASEDLNALSDFPRHGKFLQPYSYIYTERNLCTRLSQEIWKNKKEKRKQEADADEVV